MAGKRAGRAQRTADGIAGLTAFLIAGGTLYCLLRGIVFEFKVGAASLVIFCLIQFGLNRLRRPLWLRIPPWMMQVVSFIALSSVFFGRFFFLYRRIGGFDKSQHLLYGMAFCMLGFAVFYRMNPRQRSALTVSRGTVAWFAGLIGLLGCFLWEVYEFVYDRCAGSNLQHWKDGPASGVIDTMLDLLIGLAGAALISLIGYHLLRRPDDFYNRLIKGFMPEDRPGQAGPVTNP